SAKAPPRPRARRGAARCRVPVRRRCRHNVEDCKMAEMFSTLGTWNWLIFGLLLMGLELLAPGVFLFWLGLAALLVGLLSFIINPSWQLQLLMFAVFAVAAVPLWRHFARRNSGVSKSNPFLN